MLWTTPCPWQPDDYKSYQTGAKINQQTDESALKLAKIAVISYGEAHLVRKAWYELSGNFPAGSVLDLGAIQGGEQGLQSSLEWVKNSGLFTIILSPAPLAPEQLAPVLSPTLSVIDSQLNFGNPWLNHPNYKPASWLAYQGYFNEPEALALLNAQSSELLRLGLLKNDLSQAEPLLRDQASCCLHLRAVRAADCPSHPNPNGLSAAEACRLLRYAAISDKLQLQLLHGYQNPSASSQNQLQTAHLLAQLVWFGIEGYFSRKGDEPLRLDKLQCYTVSLQEWNEPLYFFKSPQSDRWWFAVPSLMDENQPAGCLRPCSYSDYEKASQGELSERIWGYLS